MNRTCIFIDGSNFYHQLKELPAELRKIDYHKLSVQLVGSNGKLIRTYFYICPLNMSKQPENARKQQRFFSNLYNTPFLELRFGRFREFKGSFVEKGVDVQLAIDMVSLAHENAYDTAILVSNDDDLAPAVELVKR